MDFEDVETELSVFKKLHTAYKHINKTVFYDMSKNPRGKMIITRYNGLDDVFDMKLINHMSLNRYDGLLIQYDSLDGRKMFPYRFNDIKDIVFELNNSN